MTRSPPPTGLANASSAPVALVRNDRTPTCPLRHACCRCRRFEVASDVRPHAVICVRLTPSPAYSQSTGFDVISHRTII
eukprot:2162350-Prymnesium_polylepis.2